MLENFDISKTLFTNLLLRGSNFHSCALCKCHSFAPRNSYFLVPIYVKEIIVFRSNFLKGDFDGFTNLEVLPEFKNNTFSSWSLCLYTCVVISITQKQITAETSNLVFNIRITYRCYLKLFIKVGQKLGVQGHTKNSNTLRPMDEISC